MKINNMSFTLLFIAFITLITACNQGSRKITNLNGKWEFEIANDSSRIPDQFSKTIPVPGLVDLAEPAITKEIIKNDSGMYYWYKTQFTLNEKTPVCILKIHKAQYGKVIYVNNKKVTEHFYSYTPLYVDISKFLNPAGTSNELMIRIGNYYNFPDSLVNGHDFEKKQFIAGIYDNVELIQCGYPMVKNSQIVPDIYNAKIKVVSEINSLGNKGKINLKYQVTEHKSGKMVSNGKLSIQTTGNIDTAKFEVPMPGFTFWSPDNPFLYDLKITTSADQYQSTFGMREFRFDTTTHQAMLNGKVYYFTGTNVPVFRFFEDSLRGNHPWDKQWATRLNQQFKNMNWNIIRYHVGPAPDFWYDLADEMGILVQDEFSVWFGYGMKGIRPNLKAQNLAAEYTEWMRERWNHPSVVIWDAQNETVTPETGKAINMVRHLDLSNRPWDNGWSRPQSATDAIESHPYLFYAYREKIDKLPEEGILKSLMSKPIDANNDAGQHDPKPGNYKNVRFINEYGWLWVNRDGSATTLTDWVYKNMFGDTLTNQQRLYWYARLEAMLTEYWRCHRRCSGVMHFAGLTYSRPAAPRGQTSDNFASIETLEFEPNFVKYVKPAFAPVGLMLDTWEKSYKAGSECEVPVYAINDLYSDWQGELTISVLNQDKVIATQSLPIEVKSLGQKVKKVKVTIPVQKGNYQLKAAIQLNNQEVFSLRDLHVE